MLAWPAIAGADPLQPEPIIDTSWDWSGWMPTMWAYAGDWYRFLWPIAVIPMGYGLARLAIREIIDIVRSARNVEEDD